MNVLEKREKNDEKNYRHRFANSTDNISSSETDWALAAVFVTAAAAATARAHHLCARISALSLFCSKFRIFAIDIYTTYDVNGSNYHHHRHRRYSIPYLHWPVLESYHIADSRVDMVRAAYADAAHSFRPPVLQYCHRIESSLSTPCDTHRWCNVLSMLPYHHDIPQRIADIVFALHYISLMIGFLEVDCFKWKSKYSIAFMLDLNLSAAYLDPILAQLGNQQS